MIILIFLTMFVLYYLVNQSCSTINWQWITFIWVSIYSWPMKKKCSISKIDFTKIIPNFKNRYLPTLFVSITRIYLFELSKAKNKGEWVTEVIIMQKAETEAWRKQKRYGKVGEQWEWEQKQQAQDREASWMFHSLINQNLMNIYGIITMLLAYYVTSFYLFFFSIV